MSSRPVWIPAFNNGQLHCCHLTLRYGRARKRKNLQSSVILTAIQSSDTCTAEGQCSPVLLTWSGPNDERRPRNWPSCRKWIISVLGFCFTGLASISVSSYSITASVIQQEFHCSRLLALAGLSIYTVMFGVAPMLLAPLSELYGRRIVYIASVLVYTIFQIPQAAASNIATLLVGRFFSAIGGSTGISLIGGTLSDLFDDHHRGLPMLMFAFSAFAPTALGPICFGYVGMLEGFRLAAWIQFGLAGLLSIAICLLQGETREDVILSKLAPKLTRESGRPHCATAESKKSRTVGQILQTTLGRPFRLLAFEPILQAWTLYVSFAWGVLYLLLLSIPIIYTDIYKFNLGEVGLVYITQIIGATLALPLSLHCDRLYRKHVRSHGPEARMFAGMAGGLLLALGAWQSTWTAASSVHWTVPLVGITFVYCGLMQIYLTAFSYVTDVYAQYAASALAAMNLGRNTAAAAVPLFGNQTYEALGIHGAGSLVAGLATLLALIPFVIYTFGSRLRTRSAFAMSMQNGLGT